MIRLDSPLRLADPSLPALARWIVATIAVGALLAILGPFGSYLNESPVRLFVYWIGAMLLGLVLYGSAYRLICLRTPPSSRQWWPPLIAAALIVSVPEALATRAAAFWLWPELARVAPPLSLWFAQTATIGLVAMSAVALLKRRTTLGRIEARAPAPAIEPAAMPLNGDVLALQMEDHYVRVHRPAGTELLLMPLGRAIAAMAVPGLRTHRSWWVARHAVEAVEGNARSMRLRLSNGAVAPVARSAVIHLKAAGWLDAAANPAGFTDAAARGGNASNYRLGSAVDSPDRGSRARDRRSGDTRRSGGPLA